MQKCVVNTEALFSGQLYPTLYYRILASEIEPVFRDPVNWGKTGKTQLVSLAYSNNFDPIVVKMDRFVFEVKSPFRMPKLFFTFKLDWVFITKMLEFDALIRSQ